MEKLREMNLFVESEELSDRVWRHVADWDGFSKDTMGRELVNSVDSISTSIAEGRSHRSRHGRMHYLYTARGHLFKAFILLERSARRGLGQGNELAGALERLMPQINDYIASEERSAE
ncbi:MAG: four helix bundle protein [Elusimicrobia bacterium]|nr:four helix bundle protein [Elusimicrobiota bacterium]